MYDARILKLLYAIQYKFVEVGWHCDAPGEMHCDDFNWGFLVSANEFEGVLHHPTDDDIDVSFKICESSEYDGTLGGIAFRLDITRVGGAVLGGMCPCNYTDRVWVDIDDDAAIEERFKLFEEADPDIPFHLNLFPPTKDETDGIPA